MTTVSSAHRRPLPRKNGLQEVSITTPHPDDAGQVLHCKRKSLGLRYGRARDRCEASSWKGSSVRHSGSLIRVHDYFVYLHPAHDWIAFSALGQITANHASYSSVRSSHSPPYPRDSGKAPFSDNRSLRIAPNSRQDGYAERPSDYPTEPAALSWDGSNRDQLGSLQDELARSRAEVWQLKKQLSNVSETAQCVSHLPSLLRSPDNRVF